ncbi:MAG: PLP-dependent aspartate aminotransferase family protein [Patescibacteria group bacterium]
MSDEQQYEIVTPLVPGLNLATTYVARTAQEMADWFQELLKGGHPYIYQRFGTPLITALEEALPEYEDGASSSLVFRAGMAAITAAIMGSFDPRERPVIVHTEPLYGCTYDFLLSFAPRYGYKPVSTFKTSIREALDANGDQVCYIFTEYPTNPIISFVDLDDLFEAREEYFRKYGHRPLIIVDSTFLSPVLCHPFEHGADLVVHSATKFLGGHSDVLGGVIYAKEPSLIERIRQYRNVFGNIMDEVTAYLLLRSLDTLRLRVPAQAESAQQIAEFLAKHPAVERVMYPGLLDAEKDGTLYATYRRTCTGPGSMISFYLKDPTRQSAFRVIDAVKKFKRAVSLGGSHSLIEHPASTTHAGVPENIRNESGVTENLIRVSVGFIEPASVLIHDLSQALAALN